MKQVILSFLPGYYWDGATLRSTGITIYPSQHINSKNGEIMYYVKPVDWPCSCYIRHQGIIDYVDNLTL